MPLILVQDLAHARIGEVGPTDYGADEIMLRRLFKQPARLFHAGAARDHDRAIELIAFEDGKQEGRKVFGSKVLVGIDARESRTGRSLRK